MILYFSATGNNKYVAQQLSNATGNRMVPLKDLVRQHMYELTVEDHEDFGVVMPTYWEGLPSILTDYLKKADIHMKGTHHYCYFVATYGCDYGNILSTAKKEFAEKGIVFDSLYTARFVDNWSPMFDLTDLQRNHRAEQNGKMETARIVQMIIRKEEGHDLPDQMTPQQASAAKQTYDRIRKTRYFQLNSSKCIGCGLCAGQCPVSAIQMRENHPVWVKDTCTLCLGCFHRCPVGAIDYDHSLKNGQYVNPDVTLDN